MWCSKGPLKAHTGVSSTPVPALSQGNIAPLYPCANAFLRAGSNRSNLYSTNDFAISGCNTNIAGNIHNSVSQKTCPLYPRPLRPIGDGESAVPSLENEY